MPWSQPDFVEITLNMEVTAYVNTDDKVGVRSQELGVREAVVSTAPKVDD